MSTGSSLEFEGLICISSDRKREAKAHGFLRRCTSVYLQGMIALGTQVYKIMMNASVCIGYYKYMSLFIFVIMLYTEFSIQ